MVGVFWHCVIETCVLPAAGDHGAGWHPAGDGPVVLCVEAVSQDRTGPRAGPQGGRPAHLQLHQENRNGKTHLPIASDVIPASQCIDEISALFM